MFSTLDIKHKQNRFYRRFPIYNVWGGAYWRGRLINFSFPGGGGGLLEGGALKRGRALIRGFTVQDLKSKNMRIEVFVKCFDI